MDLIATAKQFVAAIAAGAHPDEVAKFYAPDVVQTEFPNRLAPKGATRNLAELHEAGMRGRQVLKSQTYEVTHAVQSGNTVVLEAIWTGTLAIAAGTLNAGDTMRAHFAQVFEFKDGLIRRQRNYDCFDAW